MARHQDQTEGFIHQPYNWVWADNTAKTAEVPVSGDNYKIGLLLNNGSGVKEVYYLSDYTGPTWVKVGSSLAGGGLTSVVASDVDSESATDGYVLTADGVGGAAWEAPAGGSGGGADFLTVQVFS